MCIKKIKESNFEADTQEAICKQNVLFLFENFVQYEAEAKRIRTKLKAQRSCTKKLFVTSGVSFTLMLFLIGSAYLGM